MRTFTTSATEISHHVVKIDDLTLPLEYVPDMYFDIKVRVSDESIEVLYAIDDDWDAGPTEGTGLEFVTFTDGNDLAEYADREVAAGGTVYRIARREHGSVALSVIGNWTDPETHAYRGGWDDRPNTLLAVGEGQWCANEKVAQDWADLQSAWINGEVYDVRVATYDTAGNLLSDENEATAYGWSDYAEIADSWTGRA